MIVRCLSFGSLWWLRPGNQTSDPLRFSTHAAAFNTTGFRDGSRERRLWHVSGVVRINLASQKRAIETRNFEDGCYQSPGPERRGEWNRLLLGKHAGHTVRVDRLLLCTSSTVIGRIDFDNPVSLRLSGQRCRGERAFAFRADRYSGANAAEMRGFANPFRAHSPRPFASSGCLPPEYLIAHEAAERQRDISDYPPKTSKLGGVDGSGQEFGQQRGNERDFAPTGGKGRKDSSGLSARYRSRSEWGTHREYL
jgi:hypothetical protein